MAPEHVSAKNDDKRKQQIQALMESFGRGKCGLYDFAKRLTEIRDEHCREAVQRLG